MSEVLERPDDGPTEEGDLTRYALVDLAVARDLSGLITGAHQTKVAPLLAWTMPAKVLEVGPWLVDLGQFSECNSALLGLPLEMPWGMYLESRAKIASLRHSLRRFNLAEIPGAAKPVLFRYWDPRVMAGFLQVATEAQRKSLMRDIVRLHAPNNAFDITQI